MSWARWIAAAGTAAAMTYPALAEKPDGGICACGPYIEAPTLCAPLTGADRDTCIRANVGWNAKCTGWRTDFCRAPATAAEPAKTAIPPLPQVAAAPPVAPPSRAASPDMTKFGGSWAGEARCGLKSDKWHLTMAVAQMADGRLFTTATTSLAAGNFSKVELNDNDVVLHYDNWLSTTVYAGRLVGTNRIEGKVRVAGRDCSWYLAR